MINFEFSNTTQIIFGKGTESQVGTAIRSFWYTALSESKKMVFLILSAVP